jgi:hypothetical protein
VAAAREHRSGHRLQQHVLARAVHIGPVLAVAGDRYVDDRRVDPAHALVVEAQALRDARAIVLQEHVRVRDQLAHDLLPAVALEIDGERALVAVEREERDVDLVAGRTSRRRETLPFARCGLDLDDIGAEVAEALGGERPGHRDGAVDDAVAVEDAA